MRFQTKDRKSLKALIYSLLFLFLSFYSISPSFPKDYTIHNLENLVITGNEAIPSVDKYIQHGTLTINSGGLLDLSNAEIVFHQTSILTIAANNLKRGKKYKLIKYNGTLSGQPGNITFSENAPPLEGYSIVTLDEPDGKYLALSINGTPELGDNDKLKSGLGKCFNQKQVANTLDYLYNNGQTSDSLSGDAQKVSDRLQSFMDMQGNDDNIPELKDRLFDLSGYFISNVIMGRAYDDEKIEIHNIISNSIITKLYDTYAYKDDEQAIKGNKKIWEQQKFEIISIDKDGESPYPLEIINKRLVLGFDIITSSTAIMGFYAKGGDSTVRQGYSLHTAKIKSFGLGCFGGIILKGKYYTEESVSISFDSYETTRCLRFESNAHVNGNFNGYTTIVNTQAGYISRIRNNIFLTPYGGVALALIHTSGFSENGEDVWNLEEKASNYRRVGVNGGVGFTNNGKKYTWNASLGLHCLLAGKNVQTTGKFIGGNSLPNKDFKSISVTPGILSLSVGTGIVYFISKRVEVYGYGDLKLASRLTDVYAGIGISYLLGNQKDKKKPEVEPEVAKNISKEDEHLINKNTQKNISEPVEIDKNVAEVEPTIAKNTDDVVSESTENKQFMLSTVLFEFNSGDIKIENKKNIRDLADKIRNEYAFEKIRIEGHTDSLGAIYINKKISLDRAKAVCNILVENGIDIGKMEMIGYGGSRPIASNENNEGRSKNRRVEIFIELS